MYSVVDTVYTRVLLIPIHVYSVVDTVYTRVLLILCIYVYSVVDTCIKVYVVVYLFEQPVSKRGLQRGNVISVHTKYCPEEQSTFTRDLIILEAMFTELQGNSSVARGKCNEGPKHNVSSLKGYTSAKNKYNDR